MGKSFYPEYVLMKLREPGLNGKRYPTLECDTVLFNYTINDASYPVSVKLMRCDIPEEFMNALQSYDGMQNAMQEIIVSPMVEIVRSELDKSLPALEILLSSGMNALSYSRALPGVPYHEKYRVFEDADAFYKPLKRAMQFSRHASKQAISRLDDTREARRLFELGNEVASAGRTYCVADSDLAQAMMRVAEIYAMDSRRNRL